MKKKTEELEVTGENLLKKVKELINATFPESVQSLLQPIRQTIHQVAPEAAEAINYGLATFKLKGNLVHFGAFKDHIGFYPAPTGIEAFQKEIEQYGNSKGTVRFPLDQPIPFDLISRIVKYRVTDI